MLSYNNVVNCLLLRLPITVYAWIWHAITCSHCQTAKMFDCCYNCQVAHNSVLNSKRVLAIGEFYSIGFSTFRFFKIALNSDSLILSNRPYDLFGRMPLP